MKLLSISFDGINANSDLHLTISNCEIGYTWIHSAKAAIENSISTLESGSLIVPIGATNSSVVIKSTHIEKFTSGNFIQMIQSTCHLYNVTFTNCGKQNQYPLIWVIQKGLIAIENSTFLSNENSLIHIENKCTAFIRNSSFLHNTVEYNSPTSFTMMWILSGSLLAINSSEFSNNTILQESALLVDEYSVGIIWNSKFINNQGTCLYFYNSVGFISNCWFLQNSAEYGAAVYIECDTDAQNQSSKLMERVLDLLVVKLQLKEQSIQTQALPRLHLHNCTFAGNIALSGGALFVKNAFGKLLIQLCGFIKNQAINGGAITFVMHLSGNSTLLISKSSFKKNQASGGNHKSENVASGGAIDAENWIEHGQRGTLLITLLITRCSFHDNQASGFGGAISSGFYSHVQDSLFYRNSATLGGALLLKYGEITKCSFDSNIAFKRGGASSLTYSSTCIVSHSSFSNNTAVTGGAVDSEANTTFSCSFCSFLNNTSTGSVR